MDELMNEDARAAMIALIHRYGICEDGYYPNCVAVDAFNIAEAMAVERAEREAKMKKHSSL